MHSVGGAGLGNKIQGPGVHEESEASRMAPKPSG